MKGRRTKNQGLVYPVTQTAVVWLLLDRFHAPGWVQGMVWTVVVLGWAICLYGVFALEEVDVLKRLDELEKRRP